MASKKSQQEFQAVLMAGGNGNRLHPLSDDIPKAMLPIGNIPMIEYSLRMLDRHGFPDVIVVVTEELKEPLVQLLDEIKDTTTSNRPQFRIHVDIVDIASDMGTADALRLVQDKIYTDFIMLSCDLVTNFPLHHLVDVHRIQGSTVTMLFCEPQKKTEAEIAAKKAPGQDKVDYIGINAADSRVVHFAGDSDMSDDDETFAIRRYVLQKYPCISFRKDLLDAHLYVFAKEVLQILDEKKKLSSIKMELIPFLVRRQFAPHTKIPGGSDDGQAADEPVDFHALAPTDPFVDLMFDPKPSSSIKCFSYIAKPDECVCMRANTVQLYCDINRQILPLLPQLVLNNPEAEFERVHKTYKIAERSQVGADSVIDAHTVIGKMCSVKRSIVGKHCTIGDKVRITNCIIMDHVTIADDCILSNTVICKNAHVSTKCNLQGCRVGLEHTVPAGSTEKGEDLLKQFEMGY